MERFVIVPLNRGEVMGIWEGVKRASKVLVMGLPPGRYKAAGKKIVCEHCEHDEFDEGEVLMNSAGMTFAGLDWANKSATTLMCDRCGRINLYGVRPVRK